MFYLLQLSKQNLCFIDLYHFSLVACFPFEFCVVRLKVRVVPIHFITFFKCKNKVVWYQVAAYRVEYLTWRGSNEKDLNKSSPLSGGEKFSIKTFRYERSLKDGSSQEAVLRMNLNIILLLIHSNLNSNFHRYQLGNSIQLS